MNKQLHESLQHKASRGATLRELETEIDLRRRLLSDVEREGAWLYAWALVKRRERQPIPPARREHHAYQDRVEEALDAYPELNDE